MLSPNPANFVNVRRGAAETVTWNVQETVRCCASRTVHPTLEMPGGNVEPLGGLHASVEGSTAPATTGGGKFTTADPPVVASTA